MADGAAQRDLSAELFALQMTSTKLKPLRFQG
jgi:hypothetical protein